MPNLKRPLLPRLISLALGCAATGLAAGSTVTIANHSGQDLYIARSGSQAESPILVTARGDDPPGVYRALCARPVPGRAGSPELVGRGPEVPSVRHYLLKHGEAASFAYEDPGRDQASDLVLYQVDDEAGIRFHGIVTFTLSHRPAGADGGPEPEARLTLPRGPGRANPANRGIRVVSERELQVLPRDGSARPGASPQPF